MSGLSFTSPGRLWLLALVALLAVGYVLRQRRASRDAVRLPGLSLLTAVAPRLGWRRHVASALLLVSMAGATAAFAEPRADVQVPRERATILVALDVSLSMAATDVTPDRFTAAKAAAVEFVEGLPERFNVGLVAFSGSASVVVPATQEHAAVTAAIERLALGNGTAIGEAVASSLTAVAAVPGATSETDATPAHVVLLSDGANTVGRPVAAAVEEAVAAGVPVSTIAYGTRQGEVLIEQRRIRVPVDAPALAELAADTDGTAYEAASGDELQAVYADIGSAIGTTTESREIGAGAAGLALLATVAAGAAALAWSPRAV
jgi:Ca-activated chloride channel family protein